MKPPVWSLWALNSLAVAALLVMQERGAQAVDHTGALMAVTTAWVCGALLLARSGRGFWVPLVVLLTACAQAWLQTPLPDQHGFSHWVGLGYAVPVMALAASVAHGAGYARAVTWAVALGAMGLLVAGGVFMGIAGKPLFGLEQVARQLHAEAATWQASWPLAGAVLRDRVNPNALGGTALALLPLCLGVARAALHRRWWVEAVLLGLAGGLAVVCLVMSQSRSAIVGAVVLASVFVLRRVASQRVQAVAAVGAALVLVVVMTVAWGLQARAPQPRAREVVSAQSTLATRVDIWNDAWGVVRAHWLTGIGLSQFRLGKHSSIAESQAENILLQTALDLGLPGLAAYLWLVGGVLWRAARATGDEPFLAAMRSAGWYACVAMHLFGVTDAIALGSRVGTLQWLALGLMVAGSGWAAPRSR